jgi:hypothetical protein
VGEALRLDRVVLGDDSRRPAASVAAKAHFTTRAKGAPALRPGFGVDRESNR